jgi:hypothetical protein
LGAAEATQKVKESEVQKQILDYLALKGIFHYRNNSGAFVDAQKHFYRFGALGSPKWMPSDVRSTATMRKAL